MKYIIICTLLIICEACSSIDDKIYPTTDNVVLLTDENMPAVEYFTLEKIDLKVKYAETDNYVYDDSVVIIINNKRPNPYFITIYNINTQKEIACLFTKGTGPNEMVQIGAVIRHNYLYVSDYTLNRISRINIDSVLIQQADFKPKILQFENTITAKSFDFTSDDTITALNDLYIKGFGTKETSSFVQYDVKNGNCITCSDDSQNLFPGPPFARSMAYTNKGFVVFWARCPIITIYNNNFIVTKMYRDSDFEDPELIVKGNSPIVLEKSDSYFFNFGTQTENFIFATSPRFQVSSKDVKKEFYQSDDFPNKLYEKYEIFCFDNSFNLVRRLKPRKTIKSPHGISYCEQSGNMYITAMNENEEYCLYKCIFEK